MILARRARPPSHASPLRHATTASVCRRRCFMPRPWAWMHSRPRIAGGVGLKLDRNSPQSQNTPHPSEHRRAFGALDATTPSARPRHEQSGPPSACFGHFRPPACGTRVLQGFQTAPFQTPHPARVSGRPSPQRPLHADSRPCWPGMPAALKQAGSAVPADKTSSANKRLWRASAGPGRISSRAPAAVSAFN